MQTAGDAPIDEGSMADRRVEQIVDLIARTNTRFDLAVAWQIIIEARSEAISGATPTPLEVLFRVSAELLAQYGSRESYAESGAHEVKAAPYAREAHTSLANDATLRAMYEQLQREHLRRNSDTDGELEPVLAVKKCDPIEIFARLTQLLRHGRKVGPFADLDKAALHVLERTCDPEREVDVGLIRATAVSIEATAKKLATKASQSVLGAWAYARAARLWWRAYWQGGDKSDAASALRTVFDPQSGSGALAAERLADVPGLLFNVSEVVLSLRNPKCEVHDKVPGTLRPVMRQLIDAYLSLGERRILDRIGVCGLLASAAEGIDESRMTSAGTTLRVARSVLFAWEGHHLSARYLAQHGANLAELGEMVLPKAKPDERAVLMRVLTAAQEMSAGSGTLPRRARMSRYQERRMAKFLIGVSKSGGLFSRVVPWLEQARSIEEQFPSYRLALTEWRVADAEAAPNHASTTAEKVLAWTTLAAVREHQGDVSGRCAALDAALDSLPAWQVDESTSTADARWMAHHARAMEQLHRRDLVSAAVSLRAAAHAAANAFLLDRVCQSISSLLTMVNEAEGSAELRPMQEALDLFVGFSLIAGKHLVVATAVGTFAPDLWSPSRLRAEVARTKRAAFELIDRERRRARPDLYAKGQKARLERRRVIFTWATLAVAHIEKGSARELLADIAVEGARQAQASQTPHHYRGLTEQLREIDRMLFAGLGADPAWPDAEDDAADDPNTFPTAQQAALKGQNLRRRQDASPMQVAEILLALVSIRLHLSRFRGGGHAADNPILAGMLDAVNGLAPDRAGGSWWRETRLEPRIRELRARLAGAKDGAADEMRRRREQLEWRYENVREMRRTKLLGNDPRFLERDLASAFAIPGDVPLDDVKLWLDRVKPFKLPREALARDEEAEVSADTPDDPMVYVEAAEEFAQPDVASAGPGTEKLPHVPDHVDGAVILEFFLAPVAASGPRWDALCLALRVSRTADGVRIRPERVFTLGDSPQAHRRTSHGQIRSLAHEVYTTPAWRERALAASRAAGQIADRLKAIDGLRRRLGALLFPAELIEWLRSLSPPHVYLCPYGSLFHLPLHALPTANGRPLVGEDFTYSYLSKHSQLERMLVYRTSDRLAKASPHLIVDRVDPDVDRGVAALMGAGSFQTPATVTKALALLSGDGGGVVMCHGVFDSRRGRAWRSRLLLDRGVRVSVADIERHEASFDGAEIAVMACHGAAVHVSYDAGTVGITDAFLRRGASNVIAPLWSIDTETAGIVSAAYLRERGAGRPPRLSLREAVRVVAERQDGAVDDIAVVDSWLSWAPFAIYGVG